MRQMSRTDTLFFISAPFAIPTNPKAQQPRQYLISLGWVCTFLSRLASAHFPLGFLMNIEINLASPLVHSTLRTFTSCSSCQCWCSHGLQVTGSCSCKHPILLGWTKLTLGSVLSQCQCQLTSPGEKKSLWLLVQFSEILTSFQVAQRPHRNMRPVSQ